MKLTLRFVVLIAALLMAIAASTAYGLHAMTELDTALSRVVDNDFERLLAITHTRRLFRSMVVLERDYIMAKTPAERAPMDKKTGALAGELLEQIDKYARLMPAADAKTVAAIRGVRERFIELNEKVRAASKESTDAGLALAKQHNQDPVSWEKVIGGLVKLSEERLAAQVKQTHQVYVAAKQALLWVSALAALLAMGLGYAIFAGIRRNVSDVVRINENLESLVKARTELLTAREHSLRMVLDSTGDGLFEVGRDGSVVGAGSAAALRWFGSPSPHMKLADYLFPDDAARGAQFAMAFEQLAEDVLPWDLCHDQMPRRITRGERIIELDFKRVLESEKFSKILVVSRDVTDSVQSERLEQSAREQQELITKLLQDKQGFAQFVKDTETLLASLSTGHDVVVAKRELHTIKGNTAIFGLMSMAEMCHRIEERMADEGNLPSAAEIADLASQWRTRLQSIESFLSALGVTRLEIDLSDHARLLESLLKRQDYTEIVDMVELWSWPRTAERLTRLRAHAEHLASRLEKPVEVTIVHSELRAPRDYLEKFWPALIHVIRNAVDHAAQSEAERTAQHKPAATQITLSTKVIDDHFVVEIKDDGTGVDRDALLRAARAKSAEIPDSISLDELMFMDGVSSRSNNVTQTSGRGVGLAAVRQACEADGGKVEVITARDQGTTFRFRFRQPVVKPGALAARLERRWSLRPTMSAPPPIAPPPAANSNAAVSGKRAQG